MNKFVPIRTVSPFTEKLFGWLEWVIMGGQPLTFCEDKYSRKYSNISQVGGFLGRKCLAKYIDFLAEEVCKVISKELPPKFGLIFDGWSCDGEHYIACIATWTDKGGGLPKRLLSCGVQDLPDGVILQDASSFGFTADDTGDYIIDVLSKFGRQLDSLEFLSGDNCSVNGLLAAKITQWLRDEKKLNVLVPLVGCASHRLNLAVRLLYEGQSSPYHAIVKKVNELMVELRTLKNKYKLASKTKLTAVKKNDTRWGSTHAMIKRCLELRDVLPTCAFSEEILEMIPTAAEYRRMEEFMTVLNNCQEVSMWLQQEDALKVPLELVRTTFDSLMHDYPVMKRHLSPASDIVHDKHFENGVVKIQRHELIMTPHRRCMDPSTLEAILILRYNRDVWDIYFVDSIVSMVQSGGVLGPAADYGLDESTNPIGMDAANENAEFEEQLETEISESAEPLPCQGRR